MAFFRKDTVSALENQLVAAEKAAAEATAEAAAALDDPAMTPGKLAPIQAARDLALHRAGKVQAELEAARAKADADAREAEIETYQEHARKAGDEGAVAAKEAVEALRRFVIAWGKVEAARTTTASAGMILTRKYERELSDTRGYALPNAMNFMELVWGGNIKGKHVHEEVSGLGYVLPVD